MYGIFIRRLLLMAPFAGSDEIRGILSTIRREMNSGFQRVISAIHDNRARQVAEEFYAKQETLKKMYNGMIDDIASGRPYSSHAKDSARDAQKTAIDFCSWTKAHLLKSDRAELIKNFPFIVAMAFSVRVEMDSLIIQSEMEKNDKEKEPFMSRIRRSEKELIETLFNQLCGLVKSSSLLEIAFDLHVYVATYITLIKSFRASLSLLPSSSSTRQELPCGIHDWDDGLSPLR